MQVMHFQCSQVALSGTKRYVRTCNIVCLLIIFIPHKGVHGLCTCLGKLASRLTIWLRPLAIPSINCRHSLNTMHQGSVFSFLIARNLIPRLFSCKCPSIILLDRIISMISCQILRDVPSCEDMMLFRLTNMVQPGPAKA